MDYENVADIIHFDYGNSEDIINVDNHVGWPDNAIGY